MKPQELMELSNKTPHLMVELMPSIEKLEVHPMPGMRAKLLSIVPKHEDGEIIYYEAVLDFKGFEEYNKQFDQPVFYNKDGNPIDTWHESLFYPDDGREKLFIDPADDVISIVTNDVFDKYIESGTDKSYVTWMEELILLLWCNQDNKKD